MSIRILLLTTALLVGLFAFLGSASVQAADDDVGIAAAEVSPQIESAADDSRVEVQTYTVLAAVGAGAVALLVFMVRAVMGWVKPPPVLDESDH